MNAVLTLEYSGCLCSVQCDQLKPRCSRCTRLDLQCTGAGVQRFKFVVHDPAAGKLPLNGSTTPSIQLRLARPLPGNGAERLISSLVKMLGPDSGKSSFINLFGPVFSWLPLQVGAHPALDAAIAYTIHGHQSFRGVDGADRSMIKSGSTAVACLQKAIMKSPSDMSNTILMAMIVHTAAEVCYNSIRFVIDVLTVDKVFPWNRKSVVRLSHSRSDGNHQRACY